MPWVQLLLFTLLFSVAMAILHGYIGWRLIGPSGLPPRARGRVWMVLGASVVVQAAVIVVQFSPLPAAISNPIVGVGYFILGAVVLTWSFLVLRDLAWLLVRAVDAGLKKVGKAGPLPADPERRRVLLSGLNLGVLGLSGTGTAYGYLEAKRLARVVDVEVPLENLEDDLQGFTVVQISDIHIGPTIKGDYLRAVVETVNELSADLVAVTGDLVDGSVPELGADVAPLGDLKSRLGTYFVTGNHEYYSGVEPWVSELERLGLRVLLNAHDVAEHRGRRVLVAGVTDLHSESVHPEHISDPERCVEGAPDCDLRILLAHQPGSVLAARDVEVGPSKRPFDVQLSGHTHGGQFIPWNLLVTLAHPVNVGLKRFLGRAGPMWVYVNRGTGYWGPPLRLGVPAEITRLRFVRAA